MDPAPPTPPTIAYPLEVSAYRDDRASRRKTIPVPESERVWSEEQLAAINKRADELREARRQVSRFLEARYDGAYEVYNEGDAVCVGVAAADVEAVRQILAALEQPRVVVYAMPETTPLVKEVDVVERRRRSWVSWMFGR